MYRTLLSLTLFTLLLLGTSPAVGQTTYTVSSGQSIQAAIAGASNGDTIEVEAGTYTEDVIISKSLTLNGPNAGIAGADSRGAEARIEGQVVLSADNAILDGFEVSPPDVPNNTQKAEAVRISNTPNGVTVRNSIVRDFTDDASATNFFDITGINVFGGNGSTAIMNATVSDNLVERIARDVIGGAVGISIQGNVAGAMVTGNVIRDIGRERSAYGFGIVVRGTGNHSEDPTGVIVENNTIENLLADPTSSFRGVGLGLEVGNTADATFQNNTVTNAQFLFEDKTTTVNLEDIIASNDFDVAILTDNSGLSQDVIFGVLQDAIGVSVAGATLSVYEGTYDENVIIDKSLTLRAPDGRDVTTIQGSLAGDGFGTVNIANGVNNVNIGSAGQGFTIIGFPLDDPAQEGAAIRFSGASTGSEIIGNELIADGEAALLVLFNQAIEDLTVDSNIISGKTFEGTPAGSGFSSQFTVLNVPRQLVTISGGSGVTNIKNIIFTNNEIVGTAGGINDDGDPQGNTLVTIDAVNSTISDNVLSGTTTRFGSSLRVRGPNATIDNNSFQSDGLTSSNTHLFLQNNTLNDALVNANTFDKGVYVVGGVAIAHVIQPFVDAVPSGTIVNVLSGTYEESLTIEKALTIQAAPGATPKPVIIGQSTNAVAVDASNVTISGLDIQNPVGGGPAPSARNAVGIRIAPGNTSVSILGNHIRNIATAVETNPLGIVAFDGAIDLIIENNTLENLRGTDSNDGQAQAILLIQESISDPTAITGALIKGNTIRNVSDTRSAVAIRFNGDVQGTIQDNVISRLFTDGPAGTGFTQAIAFAKGGNGATSPSNLTIIGNMISNLEDPADNGTGNFVGASHVIFSNDVDPSTVTITGNSFNAATLDEGYVVDLTTAQTFELVTILNNNTYDPAGQIIDGTGFRAIVPTQPAECPVPEFAEELFLDQGFLTITFDDPNGINEVNFVNPEDEDALTNFEASPDNSGYESNDGIRFAFNDPGNAPTEVTFTLQAVIPDDHDGGETFTASYFAQAKNGCGSVIDVDPIHTLSTDPVEALTLHGNYPNPFVGSTTIEFDLPEATDVRLEVFDLMGRTVTTLVDGLMDAGNHRTTWDGTLSTGQGAASGVYILRLKAGDQQLTRRITRIR